MKIVHIQLCGPYNEGWSYQENCLSYYHKQAGNEVTVIAAPFIYDKESRGHLITKTGEYYDKNGIKIIRKNLRFSHKSNPLFQFRMYKGLFETLLNEQPDIIFVHGCQFLDIRYVVKYALQHPNIVIYVDNHADFLNSAKNWLSKNILHGIIWKYCAKMIEPYTKIFYGVLPARVNFLIEMYNLPKEKVKLLVMGAEDEKVIEAKDENLRKSIRKQHGIKDDDFLVMTGGKINRNKSETMLLMEAVKIIDRSDIKLIVFGSVSSEVKEKFSTLLCDNVKYIGWIDSNETYKYFNVADLIVFPGLHSVFWEQVVGLGKPCVFKYMEGFTHIDLGGNCRFLYEGSVAEIKRVISEIVDNQDIFEEMKKVAVIKGMDVFSYEEIARKSISNE